MPVTAGFNREAPCSTNSKDQHTEHDGARRFGHAMHETPIRHCVRSVLCSTGETIESNSSVKTAANKCGYVVRNAAVKLRDACSDWVCSHTAVAVALCNAPPCRKGRTHAFVVHPCPMFSGKVRSDKMSVERNSELERAATSDQMWWLPVSRTKYLRR